MQFTVSWIYIIDIGTRHIPNMKTCSVYWYQNRKSQRINAVDRSRGIYISVYSIIFNSKAQFVCVKDRVCLKVAIPAYCFTIFGSMFGVLFCLLIKKLILGSKTIWQSLRKFPCAVWSVRTFLNLDKEETFFPRNCTLVWSDSF